MWRKKIDTKEIISYEFNDLGLKSIIEARFNEIDNCWDVYHTFFSKDNHNYTEEFTTTTREDAEKLVLKLKDKRVLADQDIYELKLKRSKRLRLDIKRLYKDYNVEKWGFVIDKDVFENIVYVREGEPLVVDIILHESYKAKEERIVRELHKILGLGESESPLKQSLFYYAKRKEEVFGSSRLVFGNVELGLDEDSE